MRTEIRRFKILFLTAPWIAGIAACGGGGSSSPSLYPVGGAVTGLSANATLTLSNDGGDTLAVKALHL